MDNRDTAIRQRWSETEARAALAELARTGESAVAFAKRHGISKQRVAYWKKRLEAAPVRGSAFVAVAMPEAAREKQEIEIQVDGLSVCVREDIDVERLARIVGALGVLVQKSR